VGRFVVALGYFYRQEIEPRDAEWGREYLATHDRAEHVAGRLIDEYNRLLSERHAKYDENGIKKPTSNDR
jgi:hypothetical protein